MTFIKHYHYQHAAKACWIFFALIATVAHSEPFSPNSPPNVMLAESYAGQDISGWLVSEKLDGVRGYWDGEKFFSRNGKLLPTPPNFSKNFPPFALDGELFIARGKFDQTSGIIRTGENWSEVNFYVFDVPDADGGLIERLQVASNWLDHHFSPHLRILSQTPIDDINAAQKQLILIEQQGGEGLILRDPIAPYQHGRSAAMLKLKRVEDGECVITAHNQGRGKYAHLLGSVSCQLDNGRIIRIGSGFSDAERANPPAIGTIITFRYRGLTSKGNPRFASFWRIRSDADLSK